MTISRDQLPKQPLDCRAAGVSDVCYRTCPTFNFPQIEQLDAMAINDVQVAQGLSPALRAYVVNEAGDIIRNGRNLTGQAAEGDRSGPWQPDFTQLPENTPNRAKIVQDNTIVCCLVGRLVFRGASPHAAFTGAILTKPERK